MKTEESHVKALEDQFAAAVRAKDVDGIMKIYTPDVFVFDLVPPRQYVGAAAYRKDWQALISSYKGPIEFEITDLSVEIDGNTAFGHSIQRLSGTGTKGQQTDMTVRVTDVYRKVKGEWRVAQEHVSVPVDLETMKPDMSSRP
jgi:uncharacterized protein (TIGR02246 family)